MTKADISERIHSKLGFNKKESADMLESVLDIIKTTLESGDKVKIQGFGRFDIKEKDSRKGRNPSTGKTMILPARRIVTFKLSGLLKARINKG
jgi:integration host factor subunit alpha